MSSPQRTGVLILCVALLAAVAFLPGSQAQPVPPPAPPTGAPPTTAPAAPGQPDTSAGPSEAVSLPIDRQAKKKLEAAADYVKVEQWADAARLLQAVLDAPEDAFVVLHRPGKDGKEKAVRVSARGEADRLLTTMPVKGLEFYQLQYGAAAKGLLATARAKNDLPQLDEVARRYFYTQAGADAVAFLASHHLDRGRPGEAAFYFARLLKRPGDDQLEPLTLVKAVLAFHQSGDAAAEDQAWKRLETRAGRDGVVLGSKTVSLAELRKEVNRLPGAGAGAREWRVFRGDPRRSAEGRGDVPYLEPRWRFATSGYDETSKWLDQLVKAQEESSFPSLPGAYPLAVAGKLIYRSHAGIEAVDLQTGRKAWQTTAKDLPLSLDNVMRSSGMKIHLNQWLGFYSQNGAAGMPGGVNLGMPGGIGLGGPIIGFAGGPPGGLAQFGNLGGQFGLAGASGGGGPMVSFAPYLILENTLLGTLSADDQRVYAVEDLPLPPHPTILQQVEAGQLRALGPKELEQSVYHNRLKAFDLETGKLVWEAGGITGPLPGARPGVRKPPAAAVDPAREEMQDAYFLGPPLPINGRLHVLVEKHAEIKLLCLDAARGDVVWSQPIVGVHEKLLTDVGRRMQAVHLAYADGILVCPTNAGVVVGVDLPTRSLAWAYLYREQPGSGPDGTGGEIIANPVNLNPSWKASAPIVAGSKVVFTSADGDEVHCIGLRDGAPAWRTGRTEDDLYLAGVHGDRVVLVGKSACRAVSLKDGKTELWRLATGLPSGLGAFSGPVYYLPLRAARGAGQAEICAIDVVKGRVEAHTRARGGSVPGNLLFHDGDVLLQTASEVAAFPQLSAKLAQMNERIAKNPNDPVGLTERGELHLDKGEAAEAVADLRNALAAGPPKELLPRTHQKLYDALTLLVQRDFRQAEKYLPDYQALTHIPVPEGATPEERARLEREEKRREVNYLCLLARGRERQPGGVAEALALYRDLHARGDASLTDVLDDPVVKARADVFARSRVAALFAEAAPVQRKELEEQAAREWQDVRRGGDTDALARWVALFGSAGAVGREARLDLADRLVADRDHAHFLEAEQHLLDLYQQTDDRTLAARALEALARLYTARFLMDDAVACYRSLAREFAKTTVRDGQTGADLLEELAADPRFLPFLHEPASPWADGRLRGSDMVQVLRGPPLALTFEPRGDVGPALRRQVLVFDLGTTRFRLLDRHTGQELWSQRIALDGLRNFLVQSGFANVRLPCQVRGHLAVVSLGTALFGIDLLERRILWRRPLVDAPFDQNRMMVDNNSESGLRVVLLDRTGRGEQHPAGHVGAVAGGCVAVHTAAGLAALDPLRGDLLWVRTDVYADAQSFADERNVYLVENGRGDARAVRIADGTRAQVPNFFQAYQSKLPQWSAGRTLLLRETDAKGAVVHRLYDVQTGKAVWSQRSPSNSIAITTDEPNLVGVIEPTGKVVVWDGRARAEVLRTAVDPRHLKDVRAVHLLRDRSHWYLAFDTPPPPQNPQPQSDAWGYVFNLHTVPVNGMLYAFDRTTGEVRWFNKVPYQHLVVDQMEELPILLFAAGVNRQINPNNGNSVTVVQVLSIDKQTGKRLYSKEFQNNPQQFHAVQVDVRAKTIDLVSQNLRVRHVLAAK